MKAKNIVIAQVALLAAAVLAGAALKTDLADGPRMAHRLFGTLSGLVGLVSFVMLVKEKAALNQKVFAGIALALSVKAGLAGKMLKTASDYQFSFNVMRLSGILALASAITVLALFKKAKPASKEK